MYLCGDMTSESLQNIGKALGGRDHTTIIHGTKKIASELKTDENLKNTIDILKEKKSTHSKLVDFFVGNPVENLLDKMRMIFPDFCPVENSRVVLLDLQSYPQWFSQRFFQGFIRVFPLINKFTLPTTVKTNIFYVFLYL